MNYNEYAAREIMGWELYGGLWHEPDGSDFEREFRCDPDDWHPDKNRDQLWLVLQAFREFCDADKRPNGHYGTASGDTMIRAGGWGLYEYGEAWMSLLGKGMTDPALALKAICEAHKAGEGA